jgi:TolB-like protein
MAVAMAGGAGWWPTRTPSGAGSLSLAVLPFVNASGDPPTDYLGNGITQAVTTRLHRAGLRVIPWESARRFRSLTDPAQVARDLGVAAVLTGTFQVIRDRLRVTASLIGAAAEFISWPQQFDESLDDIVKMQTSIARSVAASIGHELTGEAAAALARTESSSAEAYDFYLQGASHLLDGDRQSTDAAFGYFKRAVGIDPDLTEAHIGLGAVYLERFWNGWGGGSGNLGLAEKAFQNALQRDARNMRAQRGLNLISLNRGTGEAHLQFARDAARLGDDDIETLLARAEVFTIDGPEEIAVPILERVLALDPWNQSAAWHLPTAYHSVGRFADTVTAADQYLGRFGADPYVGMRSASAFERLGDVEAARNRYDQTTRPLMPGPAATEPAGGYGLAALLAAGNFHSRHGHRGRAAQLWLRGLELATATLAADPDSIGMRVYYASFLGVLGDAAGFEREEHEMIARAEAAGINPSELRYLASAHANLGNTGRAIELLRYALKRGRIFGRPWLSDPILERADGFDVLRREYRAAEERRRRLYAGRV